MSSVQQNVIKHKVGLLNLAAELGNVSRACKVMGFSRDTFYRYQAAVKSSGVEGADRCQSPQTQSQEPCWGNSGVRRHRLCVGTARLRAVARFK